MYWCDAGLNRIETSDLNGENRQILKTISQTLDGKEIDVHPFDIGSYNNDVYWSDWALPAIIKMDKLGRYAKAIGSPVFEQATGLHIFIGMNQILFFFLYI